MFGDLHSFKCHPELLKQIERYVLLDSEFYFAFISYHKTVKSKLLFAYNNLEGLKGKLSGVTSHELHDEAHVYEINHFIDGFFYSMGSVLDVFAREVIVVYNLNNNGDVYFGKAHSLLSSQRPQEVDIIKKLRKPKWNDEFRAYRNVATHEMLIAQIVRTSVNLLMPTPNPTTVIPLPDNPSACIHNRSYRRNIDVVTYCDKTFRRIASLLNSAMNTMIISIRNKRTLPL